MRSSTPVVGAVIGAFAGHCGPCAGLCIFSEYPGEFARRLLGVVLENTDCAIAAVSLLAGEEGYIRGLVPCRVARWGNAPE